MFIKKPCSCLSYSVTMFMFITKQSYRKIFVMFSLNLPKFETLFGLLLLQIFGLKTIFHQIAKLQIKFRAYSRETIRYKIYQANYSNQTKIFITSSNVRRTFKRGAINYPQKVALKQVRAAAIIGVGRIFDLRGGRQNQKSHTMTSSEIFERGTFCGKKIS